MMTPEQQKAAMEQAAWDFFRNQCEEDFATTWLMQPKPITTGIPSLDSALGGGMPVGLMTVVAGEAGCGKSAFACVAAYAVAHAKLKYRPVYYSIEMSRHMVNARMLSVHTQNLSNKDDRIYWSSTKRAGDGSEMTYQEAQNYIFANAGTDKTLKAWNNFSSTVGKRLAVVDNIFEIGDRDSGICGNVRELVRSGVRPFVIVDYLQLGAIGEGKEYERVTEASRQLMMLAKECAIPMLVISSMRNIGKDERKDSPSLSWLRSSGSIGFDAGTVIILQRAGDKQGSEQPVDAHIIKNRVGPSGDTVRLYFNGGLNQFVS